MALLPLITAYGFWGHAATGSLAVLDVIFKSVQRAVMRPARETLFTVVTREEKYKSKAFTDTFVYRCGDVVGAWTEGLIGKLGLGLVGLVAIAAPLSICWAMIGLWLGYRQTLPASPAPSLANATEILIPESDQPPTLNQLT